MLLKPFTLLLILLFFGIGVTIAQVQDNAEDVFRVSQETNKPVLLVFAGSDWCAPCIRFDKNILDKSEFQNFAKDNLVILKADFPQRKPLPKNLEEQNALLAEKYNPKGLFPYLILIRPAKSVISSVSYENQSPKEFIEELKSHLSE